MSRVQNEPPVKSIDSFGGSFSLLLIFLGSGLLTGPPKVPG